MDYLIYKQFLQGNVTIIDQYRNNELHRKSFTHTRETENDVNRVARENIKVSSLLLFPLPLLQENSENINETGGEKKKGNTRATTKINK